MISILYTSVEEEIALKAILVHYGNSFVSPTQTVEIKNFDHLANARYIAVPDEDCFDISGLYPQPSPYKDNPNAKK
jgi:hypothetical protein